MPPAATATAAPFTVRCRWRSEKSGDGHARELARVLGAVAAAATDAGFALSPDVQLTLDVHDGPRELERATAALDAADVVRASGAVREASRGAVHLALRPRIADRMHHRFGTSPFLLRRAAHEGARLLVDAWLRSQELAPEAEDGWAAESVALALAEEGLRRASRSVALPDEVATSHGLVLLARALAAGAEPLALLSAVAPADVGHGEVYDAARAARLAVGAALLAPAARGDGAGAGGEGGERENSARQSQSGRSSAGGYSAGQSSAGQSATGDATSEHGAPALLVLAARPGALLSGVVGEHGETAVPEASGSALDAPRRAALRAQIEAAAAAPARWEEITPGTATWPALVGPIDPALGGDAPLVDPGGLVQWSLARVDALALATESLAGRDDLIAGTFELLPLDGTSASQADVAFADHGGGDRCLCVFNTREGTWVLKRDPTTGEYAPITGDPALKPKAGEVNAFELRVTGDTVVVALNDELMGAGRASGVDLAGRWGLGAHSGSAVIWRGVRRE